ncbi:spore coat U domain-containing protein [Variovorax sp. OV084]|uniref:Csu type fimbrial protein n=1 Tax=Variovorax sp. OV084 TaxID=1882777 RepID=UPI0008B38FA8|nr:spore coat U domain-containing protein [Variovorax sp. OV084]SET87773.1 Spore coat protein U (SCPU) domain-containing protein [Variovorax sp. OV084]
MSLLTSTLRALRLPLFCALLWLLSAGSAQASINCTATMTAVAFGTVDLVAGGTPTPATATLSYTCTKTGNTNTTEYARVCFNIGDGNEGLTNFNPRVMKSGAGDSLKFQLYQGTTSTIWGSSGNAAVPNPYTINIAIPARSTTSSGSTTMRGELIALQTTVPPGAYQDNFAGIHTSITLTSSTNAPPTTCGTAVADQFAFIVSATIAKSCLVTADPLNFGSVAGLPGGANIDQTSTINVTCTTPTAYTVALTPSNNATTGAGAMTPTGGVPGNTDTVAYRLYSNAARTSPWGGVTGTNTVAGTGTGQVQALTLYGRVLGASVNVRPDSYLDVVTVGVTY